MKQTDTAKMLIIIKTAYPNFEVNESTPKLWHEFMQHMDFEKAQRNLREHIMSNRFPPTIADIVRYDPEKERERLRIESFNRDVAAMQWEADGKDPEKFDWSGNNEKQPKLPGNWIDKV